MKIHRTHLPYVTLHSSWIEPRSQHHDEVALLFNWTNIATSWWSCTLVQLNQVCNVMMTLHSSWIEPRSQLYDEVALLFNWIKFATSWWRCTLVQLNQVRNVMMKLHSSCIEPSSQPHDEVALFLNWTRYATSFKNEKYWDIELINLGAFSKNRKNWK